MARILAPARRELRAAAVWYEQRSPGLGRRFVDAFEATVLRMERDPEAAAVREVAGAHGRVRAARLARFPYLVVYLNGPPVTVIAVAHVRRRPSFWIDRLHR